MLKLRKEVIDPGLRTVPNERATLLSFLALELSAQVLVGRTDNGGDRKAKLV
jgi:hypothetical protein